MPYRELLCGREAFWFVGWCDAFLVKEGKALLVLYNRVVVVAGAVCVGEFSVHMFEDWLAVFD